MSAYVEILKWSADRPTWQRDALRLLVSQGQIDDEELTRLVRIAKGAQGLLADGDAEEAFPLAEEHLPQQGASGSPVVLAKLHHTAGVNALAADQALTFQPKGMTVVYGDNGAGKSGYARILKRMCRARVPEARLEPNVFANAPPVEPSAVLHFRVADFEQSFDWKQTTGPEVTPRELAAISVFDTASANGYLSTADKAPFAPAGLDILEKVARVCERVKARLDSEMAADIPASWPIATVADGTAVKRLLDTLTPETSDDEVEALAKFDAADVTRIEELNTRLDALTSNDPEKKARELRAVAGRFDAIVRRLESIERGLSDDVLDGLCNKVQNALSLEEAARALRETTFAGQPLAGVGDAGWSVLWESARRFSTDSAYRDKVFPVVEERARCVLCQQELDVDARGRLQQFDEFVRSDIAKRAGEAAGSLADARDDLIALDVAAEEQGLDELDQLQPGLKATARAFFVAAGARRELAAAACSLGHGWPVFAPMPPSPVDTIKTIASGLRTDADTQLSGDFSKEREKVRQELSELQARKWLAESRETVSAEIERLRRRKRYEKCVESTQTRGITNKAAELTRKLVSESMAKAFAAELKNLDVARVGVRIETGPKRGVLLHEVRLDAQATAVPTQRVLSEGESRCVALAAFLAELATANHASGIVFDDPVSSLDHMRRRRVARRLVEEARVRQVIVFTHDLPFLLLLKEHAEQQDVPLHTEQVRALRDGAGICQPGLPWAGMNVRDRISRLNVDAQSLRALHKANDVDAYEREAKALYGRLREAWERGVEEVLLNGAVQRFERGISTKPLKAVSILEEDLDMLEQGMTKTSRWLVGHDDAPELNEPVPPPDEVRADVAMLDAWVKAIRDRRKK